MKQAIKSTKLGNSRRKGEENRNTINLAKQLSENSDCRWEEHSIAAISLIETSSNSSALEFFA